MAAKRPTKKTPARKRPARKKTTKKTTTKKPASKPKTSKTTCFEGLSVEEVAMLWDHQRAYAYTGPLMEIAYSVRQKLKAAFAALGVDAEEREREALAAQRAQQQEASRRK